MERPPRMDTVLQYLCLAATAIVLAGCAGRGNRTVVQDDAEERTNEINLLSEDGTLVFGSIGHRDLAFSGDTLSFPDVDGLVHASALAFCPADTCFADYAVLALRCPEKGPLLDWMAGRVRSYVSGWPISYGTAADPSVPERPFSSAGEICSFYMDWLQGKMGEKGCSHDPGLPMHTFQDGLLLVDCWEKGNLCTFVESRWCSDNNLGHVTYRTVDSSTGKEFSLEDMVEPSMTGKLAQLMMRRLRNAQGDLLLEQDYGYDEKGEGVLELRGGCALTGEGLVITFRPYALSSGGDGGYEAVIPYSELDGVLKPTCLADR